jgi:hypothetical protein
VSVATRGRRSKSKGPLERLVELLAHHQVTSAAALRSAFIGLILRASARQLLSDAGLPTPAGARLFEISTADGQLEELVASGSARELVAESVNDLLGDLRAARADLPHAFGALFETLEGFEVSSRAELASTRRRKRTGTFYTPPSIAKQVAERAIAELTMLGLAGATARIHDPACGGGAFLIEAARAVLALRSEPESALLRREVVLKQLSGKDLNPLAIAVTELALWTFVGDPELAPSSIDGLVAGDALTRARQTEERFELVIGNPPWVAYAGRAAQPLARERRAAYARQYKSFRGYPTLQAMFLERALELAPGGVVALLVPSPLADLDGYRPARRRLGETHEPCEPLLEFGDDAFCQVTQPCFALVARPRTPSSEPALDSERRFVLCERPRLGAEARTVSPPSALLRLFESAPLPAELFGELGFQSNRQVSEKLLFRGQEPRGEFAYPLLEGRDVREFRVGPPKLFLRPDPQILRATRCRLRDFRDYQRVRFVVRQTARAPIAALHQDTPFRNSLLAGFEVAEFPAELVVGLLNSSLYRALHLARQRDGRQMAFPQVKVAHLRSLPRPPENSDAWLDIALMARDATLTAATPVLRQALDAAVFRLFGLSQEEQGEILDFLRDRAPELATS